MRVFFLSGEWTALKRFVRGEVAEPEGMPSVYRPWLHYKKKGYDVHVFMIGKFAESRTIDYKGCFIHLVARSRFFAWRNSKKMLRFRFPADCYFLYKAAIAVGKDGHPDVIYSLSPWLSFAAWALARKYKSVNVKRIYGTWLYHDWISKKGVRNKLKCLLHFLPWKVPSDLAIITNDGCCGDKLAEMLGIDKSRYRMWLNGVDMSLASQTTVSQTSREELGLNEDAFVILCLSRLSSWKRQDRVIKAMPRILREVPNAKLIIAGDGPMREDLEKMAQDLDVHNSVNFLGMVPHSKVGDLHLAADVFCQVNDASCLGNTLLEALASGRAIVTWDVGYTGEVITDDVNGRLLPDAEPSSVAEAVIELALNSKKRERLARGARQFAKEHLLSWEQRMDKEIDLVESVKNNRQNRGEAGIVQRAERL